ncbi:unnamed protein product [Parajaminaea phylloscopi]
MQPAAAAGEAQTKTSGSQNGGARMSNHYVRRLTAEPGKSCFVCLRPSTAVLVSTTVGPDDFFYVCPSHLSDRHFATLLTPRQAATGGSEDAVRLPDKVSKEEVEKVTREYEERQKAKKEAAAKRKEGTEASDSGKDKPEKEGWMSYLISPLKDAASTAAPAMPISRNGPAANTIAPISTAPTPAVKGHEYYSLHRSFYQMRVDAHNRKTAARRAQELGFPSVPRG